MRAVICTRYGPPDVLRRLELETLTPRKNELLIRVGATEDIHDGRPTARARRIPRDVVDAALVKMDSLNGAVSMLDLRSPPGNRLNELVRGKRGVTPETAWLLARSLGTTPEYWIDLQTAHGLARSRRRFA
jgi:plasmid maintenance system antidote protein VapI